MKIVRKINVKRVVLVLFVLNRFMLGVVFGLGVVVISGVELNKFKIKNIYVFI